MEFVAGRTNGVLMVGCVTGEKQVKQISPEEHNTFQLFLIWNPYGTNKTLILLLPIGIAIQN